MKVARITLGGLCICLVLVTSRGVVMDTQKSAEAILRLPITTEGPNLKGRDSYGNGDKSGGLDVDTEVCGAHT